MSPHHTRKWIGALSGLLGVLWTASAVFPLIRKSWMGEFATGDLVFLLLMVPWLTIPGILAMVFGVRLFREMRESHLKWAIGPFAVLSAFFISSQLSAVLPDILPERLQKSVLLFASSIFSMMAYLFLVRWLLRHLTQENRSLRSLMGRGGLMLIAWQLWVLLSHAFEEYSPIKEGYTHLPEAPWDLLGLIVPFLVAYGLYRVVSHKIIEAPQDSP